jgi:hypothetical protein
MDATPFVPAAYRPYFDPNGGGGAVVTLETHPDPICGARVDTPEERARVYADVPELERCVEPGGAIRGRRVGAVGLGARREAVLGKLGPPRNHADRIDRWCLIGEGELRVAFDRRDRVAAVLSSGRGQGLRGVAHGDPRRRAMRRLDVVRVLHARHHTQILVLRHSAHRRAWVGIRGGRVSWVTIFRSPAAAHALARLP